MAPVEQVKRDQSFSMLAQKDVVSLIAHEKPPSVSIFMPTHPTTRGTRDDAIRLKKLFRRAETECLARFAGKTDVQALFEPGGQLIAGGSLSYKGKGLALFAGENGFRAYDLPMAIPEMVMVSGHFFIKPLLSLVAGDDRFYVLALSQKHVRLLRGTLYGCEDLHLHNVPADLFAAFEQESFQRQSQFHTASRADAGDRRISHGAATEIKDRIIRFFRKIDQGVVSTIPSQAATLVLAGVEYLLPLYRQVNTYPALSHDAVTGNPDLLSSQELHAAGWKLIQRRWEHEKDRARDKYTELAGSNQASNNVRDVVAAAQQGRVLFLFLAQGEEQWGSVEPGSGAVHLHREREQGDEDLLNLAAIYTLLRGGTVYPVAPAELPEGARLAALFRF